MLSYRKHGFPVDVVIDIALAHGAVTWQGEREMWFALPVRVRSDYDQARGPCDHAFMLLGNKHHVTEFHSQDS